MTKIIDHYEKVAPVSKNSIFRKSMANQNYSRHKGNSQTVLNSWYFLKFKAVRGFFATNSTKTLTEQNDS